MSCFLLLAALHDPPYWLKGIDLRYFLFKHSDTSVCPFVQIWNMGRLVGCHFAYESFYCVCVVCACVVHVCVCVCVCVCFFKKFTTNSLTIFVNWNFQEILTKDSSSVWGCDTSGNIPPCGVTLRRTCRCTEFHRVKNVNLRHPSAMC